MKLIICEKRKQAGDLASALNFTQKGKSHVGKFEGVDSTIVWCSGHLLTLKEPQEVKPDMSWQDPDTLLPLPTNFQIKPTPDHPKTQGPQPSEMLANIKSKAKNLTEIIIATDADREGEAIGWEVVEYLGWKGDIRRAWFSGGNDKASYSSAMKKLYPANRTKSWSRASEARGRSDWYYMFPTRAYTYYASYGALGGVLGRGDTPRERVVSLGRVQAVIVKIVFERDEQIRKFVAVNHYKIKGTFTNQKIEAIYSPKVTREIIDSGVEGIHWEPSKALVEDGKEAPLETPMFINREKVKEFENRMLAEKDNVKIIGYSERNKKKSPPKAYALLGAQGAIEKKFPRLNATALQTIVEDLYEQGWISYPRTEHQDIPKSFYKASERNPILQNLIRLPQLKDAAQWAMDVHNGEHEKYKPFMPSGFSDKDMEHHGLIPTQQAMDGSKFMNLKAAKPGNHATPDMMQFAYLEIVQRFIQMMLPPATIAEQTVNFEIPVEDLLGNKTSVFYAKAEQVKDYAWMSAFSNSNKRDAEEIFLKKGDITSLSTINVSSSKTSAPLPLTEMMLIKFMSDVGKTITDANLRALLKNSSGIGTPATRSTIIATTKARGYLENKGKNIHCAKKGEDLLKVVPDNMASPEMTAIWEDYLKQIEQEKDDTKAIAMRDDFVSRQNVAVTDLLVLLKEKFTSRMKKERVVSFSGKGGGAPTEKMIALARKIVNNGNGKIKPPNGVYKDFAKCKAFLDEHAGSGSGGKPSPKQVEFAKRIYDGLSDSIKGTMDKEAVFAEGKSLSEFIDKYKDLTPPSPAQIKFAKSLIEELAEGESAPEGVLERAAICRKFIDSRMSKKKSGGKGQTAKKK